MKLLLTTVLVFVSACLSAQIDTVWTYLHQNTFMASSLDLVVKDSSHYILFRETAYDTVPGIVQNLSIKGFDKDGAEIVNKKYRVSPGLMLNNVLGDYTYNDGSNIYLLIPANFKHPQDPGLQITSLIKFNYDGDTLWTRHIGTNSGTYNTIVSGIHKADDNTLLLTGMRRPSSSFELVDSMQCITQTRVDFDGNILSHREITSPLFNHLTINNSVYRNDTIFYAISKPRHFPVNNGQSTVYLNEVTMMVATDTSGNILATNIVYTAPDTTSYNNNTGYFSIEELNDGTFLLIGGQNLGVDNYVANIMNVKPDLSVNWVKSLTNLNADCMLYDVLSCDSTIKLFGTIGEFNNDIIVSNGFTLDINYNGDSLAFEQVSVTPDGYSESFWDAEVNSTGNVISSYYTYQDVDSVPLTATFAIVKLKGIDCNYTPLGIDEQPEIIKNSLFSYYPNPAIDNITLTNTTNEKTSYNLINQYGSLVDNFSLAANSTHTINLSSYAHGVYYIHAITAKGVMQTEKLVH